METKNKDDFPLFAKVFIGFLLSLLMLTAVALIILAGFETYKGYTERQLCIQKGGVYTYACHKTGDKSFELINVYE